MKSASIASMYHVCGYHDNCLKSSDTWCQYQKDTQDNTNYYNSKFDLPIDVRRAILPSYQSLCKSEMLEKCLHGKTRNANESFNGMIWNSVTKATHVGLDVLSVDGYDAIAHFNIGEKAALDIMELLKIDPGYYMTRCLDLSIYVLNVHPFIGCRNQRKSIGRSCIIPKKKQQDKNIETEGTSFEKGSF